MTDKPHFESVHSWKAARTILVFQPLEPRNTAGHRLKSIRIHVRDHELRELSVADRTLEAHNGCFVLSQAWRGVKEARRLALVASYGTAGCDAQIAGCAAHVYELGPEPPPDDNDGCNPSVVTWHDGEMFYLIASDSMSSGELLGIAGSLYE